MTREDKWDLLQLIAVLVLWLLCLVTPWIVLACLGPVWGLGSAVAAFLLYAWLGPRPFPGFLPGLLSVWILFGSFGGAAMALLMIAKHALHRGH